MTDAEWSQYASNLLKAELARTGVGYDDYLIKLLAEIRIQDD